MSLKYRMPVDFANVCRRLLLQTREMVERGVFEFFKGEEVTVIDLMRHGEPVGGELIRGHRDDPLSQTGWKQMWAAAQDSRPWQRIITSPLTRCANFALELGREMKIPVLQEGRLREIGFGEWEGVDLATLYRRCPKAVNRFWADPEHNPPPGGEYFPSFQARVSAALDGIIHDFEGEHVLVVCHGAVIRMIIALVLGMPTDRLFRLEVPYAAVSRILVERSVPRLSFHCGSCWPAVG